MLIRVLTKLSLKSSIVSIKAIAMMQALLRRSFGVVVASLLVYIAIEPVGDDSQATLIDQWLDSLQLGRMSCL